MLLNLLFIRIKDNMDPHVFLTREFKSLRKCWADGQDECCIFWLNGWAGTGQSTIARTITRKYFDEQRLEASFFFSRGGGDVGHAGKFVTSDARQHASNILPLQSWICKAITACSDIATLSLGDQWRRLVLEPLSKLDSSHIRLYLGKSLELFHRAVFADNPWRSSHGKVSIL
jgi:hypothetical protein